MILEFGDDVLEDVDLPLLSSPPSTIIPAIPAQPATSQMTTIQATNTPQVPSMPSILTSLDDQSQICVPGSSTGISAQMLISTSPSKSVTKGKEKDLEEELEQHVPGALTPEERAPPQVVPAVLKKPAREATPEAQPPQRTSHVSKLTKKKLVAMQEAEASNSTRRMTTMQEPTISSIRKSKVPV